MTESNSYDKALGYACRLLKCAFRSKRELQDKLKLHGYNQQTIEKVTLDLQEQGLIDDKRFASHWADNRIQFKPCSLENIKKQLLDKGIDSGVVSDVLDELAQNFNEYNIIKNLAKDKLRLLNSLDDATKKRRVFEYLKRRGFSLENINKVIEESV